MPTDTPPLPTWTPLPPEQQPLTPHSGFRDIAQSVLDSSAMAHDFLMKCAACGLPVDDRLQELQDHCKFCKDVLKYHYGLDY